MAGRYYPQKDIDTFDKFNKELVGDLFTNKDGIINQEVIIYKISAQDTEVKTIFSRYQLCCRNRWHCGVE